MSQPIAISVNVNGRRYERAVEPRTLLVHFLRDALGLTGTHVGCETSLCGACTVLVDGAASKACTLLAAQADGRSVTTIEGLSPDGPEGDVHPIQQAWIDEQVPQCGFCQPGQMMAALDLLNRNPPPTREEIVVHMNSNLCRCGTYPRIVKAIQTAAKEMQA